MDIQQLVNAMAESWRNERSKYHLTLGQAIEIAKRATGVVRYQDGGTPGIEDSYRGYFSDLSFENSNEPKTAVDFAKQCEAALGATYQGYKGGDFTMAEDTPLWSAAYGSCGDAIVSAEIAENGDLVLTRKKLDD